MSSVTYTKGDEWWLERRTAKGNQRYPRRILVGEYGRERVYVPERPLDAVCDEPAPFADESESWNMFVAEARYFVEPFVREAIARCEGR